jgi:hypothetical protein
MSIFYMNFLQTYSRRFCTLFVILFNLVCGVPALAADEYRSSSLTSLSGFDSIMEAGVLSGHLLGFPEKPKISAALDTTANLSNRGYNWEGPPAESPDWDGIKLDTVYFVALQFTAIVVLYFAPEKLSNWSEEDKDNYSFSKWKENVRNPVWDDDEWWVNYILHPYWSTTYYIRARERGFKRPHSFWYTYFLSALYEYGAEALFEPVSYQDFLVTPAVGILLGEYIFSPIRERIRNKHQLYWRNKAVLFITDPLGVVSKEVSQFFGVKTRIKFGHLMMKNILPLSGVWGETEILFPARNRIKPVWGIRMRINW